MTLNSRKLIVVTVSIVLCLFLTGTVQGGGNIVYTASNTIVVVDVDRGEVVKEVPLEHFITDMIFSDSGEKAYIAASNGVTVVDTREHTILTHLTNLPANSLELSPDNDFLYIMDHPVTRQEDGTQKGGDYRIEAVDLSTGKIAHTYVLGKDYYDFSLTGDGRTLYALRFQVNEIDVIDTSTWKKVRTITVDTDEPLWKSIGSRDTNELYIPQYGTQGYLWILNIGNNDLRKVELDERLKLRGIAHSSETGRLYLLSLGHLLAIDTAGEKVVGKADFDIPYSAVTVSQDGKQVYLTNPIHLQGGSISVMDGESLEIVKVIDIPTISPFTVSAKP
jgi:DNA-binding beta-propeller fold protein YncE